MPITINQLREFAFTHSHNIVVTVPGSIPDFQVINNTPLDSSVYLWLSPTTANDIFEVLYIGKAGYGTAQRMQQHRGGFTNSSTGRRNRQLIEEWLNQGRRLAVYTRVTSAFYLYG